ncbi:hypothetical protein NLJ89_g1833 [Agrocybe chaxingu]|uniref:SET domain-containing protein n=1 Tax=Agrocybe chaxingu TaxID=84603 RepID=A0A9W8MZA1_9AGAR|nr:hypothetical protein NLJ89_g1833 [Agrocybe chaxingu]
MKRGFLNTSKSKKEPHLLATQMQESDEKRDLNKSSQNVVDIAHPAPYEPKALPPSTMVNSPRADYGEGTLAVSTIPEHFEDGPADPDGHTEWIVRGPTLTKTLNLPGFPSPIPKPRRQNMYIIKPSKGMGLGMFAMCDIKAGDLILSERPLLVYPIAAVQDTPNQRELLRSPTQNTKSASQMVEYEQLIEVTLERMSDEGCFAFLSLANVHTKDRSRPLLGIIKTNGYEAMGIGDGPEPPSGGRYGPGRGYGAVCELGSRVNHSCLPNVAFWFKRSSFSMQITAIKDIKAGEELFSSYCDLLQSAAGRKAALAIYRFECKCAFCLHATPITDQLRGEFAVRVRRLTKQCEGWIRAPRVDATILDPVLQLEKDVIKEGLDTQPPYRLLLGVIQVLYTKLGMREKAKHYTEIRRRFEALCREEE